MFTGIVAGKGLVTEIDKKPGLNTITISLPEGLTENLALGISIATDGACLTVSKIEGKTVSFDVMSETLSLTTLSDLNTGDFVNIERSIGHGAEIGGHLISGHIDCTVKLTKIETPENNVVMTFEVPANFMKYVFSKGFIALNGASLTVTNADKSRNTFQVWLIPETLRLTTFGAKKVGDLINMEVDRNTQIIVDTVSEFLKENINLLKA